MHKMNIVISNELEFNHHSPSQEPEYIDQTLRKIIFTKAQLKQQNLNYYM